MGLALLLAGAIGLAPQAGPASLAEVLGRGGLRDLEGRVWRADALRGRVVVVDVWATWCAPCLAELPTLRALHGDEGVVVLGLNVDVLPRRDVVAWLGRHDVRWPQIQDGRGFGGPTVARLGVTTVPTSWLFDRSGAVAGTNLRGTALQTAVATLRAAGGPVR